MRTAAEEWFLGVSVRVFADKISLWVCQKLSSNTGWYHLLIGLTMKDKILEGDIDSVSPSPQQPPEVKYLFVLFYLSLNHQILSTLVLNSVTCPGNP